MRGKTFLPNSSSECTNRHSPDAQRDDGDGRLLAFPWQQNL